LAIDVRLTGEEDARIELGWLLPTAADVTRRGSHAKQQRESRERDARALPMANPDTLGDSVHGSTS
jgi:hypothetical protein